MKQTTRPLNQSELGSALHLSVCSHMMINLLDKLSYTNIYKHKLKLTSKAFLKEIEAHCEENLWNSSVANNNIDTANEQMQELVDFLGNLFLIGIASENIDPETQKSFFERIDQACEEFNIPLELKSDGSMSFREQKILID